jgi:hypothetical protein
MRHDPSHDPQRQQAQEPSSFDNPYPSYNPYTSYDPQGSQPTVVSPLSYPPPPPPPLYQSKPPQQLSTWETRSEQRKGETGARKKFFAQIWQSLVQLLGVRGVVVASGAVLATLTFFVLPYYSLYSGYFLAAQTLDDKWWLDLILAVLPLVVLVAQLLVPRLKGQQRHLSLVVVGSGVLGLLIHYWFMDGVISSNYWRLGTWSYFLGMALVAVGGILLSVGRGKKGS